MKTACENMKNKIIIKNKNKKKKRTVKQNICDLNDIYMEKKRIINNKHTHKKQNN